MRILISWSGERSKHVAAALRDWLPDVIQAVEPWMSDTDIRAGADWLAALRKELKENSFGVICVTRERANSPWVMFEVGALAKSVESARVCPYLIDMTPAEIPSGPLTIFQAKRAQKEGTLDLVRSINEAIATGQGRLAHGRLERAFESGWPTLETTLQGLPPVEEPATPARTTDDKTDEILQLVRELARHKDRERTLEAIRKELLKRMVRDQASSRPSPVTTLKELSDGLNTADE